MRLVSYFIYFTDNVVKCAKSKHFLIKLIEIVGVKDTIAKEKLISCKTFLNQIIDKILHLFAVLEIHILVPPKATEIDPIKFSPLLSDDEDTAPTPMSDEAFAGLAAKTVNTVYTVDHRGW